jgi:hypothetical protein
MSEDQTETNRQSSASACNDLLSGRVQGYLARNLDVCRAYGLVAGLRKIYDHLTALQNTPNWLLAALDAEIQRANTLGRPLADHRDELSPYLDR